LNVYLQPF